MYSCIVMYREQRLYNRVISAPSMKPRAFKRKPRYIEPKKFEQIC